MLVLAKFFKMQKRAFATALTNLKQQPLMTLMTSLMLGFILTWPCFLWVLSAQAKSAVKHWNQQAFFSFYLPSSLDAQTRDDILQRLKSLPNIESIRVQTPQQSLKKLMRQDDGGSLTQLGMDHALPYVIEIRPQEQAFTANGLQRFYQKIAAIPHLQGAKNNLNWFERMEAFESFINRFMFLLFVILVVGLAFLVSNTLRMVIHARYEEIQVLKLVGATNRFILSPFLYTGAAYGLFGALFAIILVDIAMLVLQQYFQPLATLYQSVGHLNIVSFSEVLMMCLASVGLSWLAAWIFVRHYLNAIEPV